MRNPDHPCRPRLLVVEDDPTLNELLAYNLRRAGYEVRQAFTGPSGLEAALEGQTDLLLLDLMLPGMDGLAVSRSLKEKRPNVPVVMLTARSEREMVLAGFESGADDYVTKPFDMEVLLARIGARLASRTPVESGRADTAHLDLVLDPDARALRTSRGSLSLKPKEYELVAFLLSQPGRLFSREEIVEGVWHHRYLPGSRSLDVHVRRLREKLTSLEAGVSIQTLRGVGLRVVVEAIRRRPARG